MADIAVHNEGSLILFQPLTEHGMKWLTDHTETESWQWLGDSLAVESRYALDLASFAMADGLEIK